MPLNQISRSDVNGSQKPSGHHGDMSLPATTSVAATATGANTHNEEDFLCNNNFAIRNRSNSFGSTCGAFYNHPVMEIGEFDSSISMTTTTAVQRQQQSKDSLTSMSILLQQPQQIRHRRRKFKHPQRHEQMWSVERASYQKHPLLNRITPQGTTGNDFSTTTTNLNFIPNIVNNSDMPPYPESSQHVSNFDRYQTSHGDVAQRQELALSNENTSLLSGTSLLGYSEHNKDIPNNSDNRNTGENITDVSHVDPTSIDTSSSFAEENEKENHYSNYFLSFLDPTDWLTRDAATQLQHQRTSPTNQTTPAQQYSLCSNRRTMAGWVRYLFYNPVSPEFTSLQQFNWAIILGVIMGIYTAIWKWFIEYGVTAVWITIPKLLSEYEVAFTKRDGLFPLYNYVWIVPSIFGGLLSYIFAILPFTIPDQNDWIDNVHSRGVQDHCQSFIPLFFGSTFAMWSGLCLGPELPLILTSSMVGSYFALITKQSMLQARVMNLTAASAAIGGFFGFPMAGAIFVLEM
jgi:Voltage gated chloride channel